MTITTSKIFTLHSLNELNLSVFSLTIFPDLAMSQMTAFQTPTAAGMSLSESFLTFTSKLLTQGYRYHKLRKTFGKFFRSYSELLSKFGDILFQEFVSKGISHPVFYGVLVYKLRIVKDALNFVSSGSKIVKRLRRRHWSIDHREDYRSCAWPFYNPDTPFLKHCTMTNKAVGTMYMTGLVQTSSEATRFWSSSLLIVSRDSFSNQIWARFQTGGA